MAEKWTNTSSPLSRAIKPNPLAALNHFTVPVSFKKASFLVIERPTPRLNVEAGQNTRGGFCDPSQP
jgi:hypothetical protein